MKAQKTPCIGMCSTTSLGDAVCRGCRRYSFEVISWNGYDEYEKLAVLRRIEKLVCQILEEKFTIVCVGTLEAELKRLSVPFNARLSPYCWLHNLFKKKKAEIKSLHNCGVRVNSKLEKIPLQEILAQVDCELQILSEAHLDRYFYAPNTQLICSGG